jgi:HAMP domain-containing protein
MRSELAARLRHLERLARRVELTGPTYPGYASDPVGYCNDILGVTLTPAQEEVARFLLEPPFRVLVKSAHKVGKSFLGACLVNWWFDTRKPSICLTTAPPDA